MAEVRVAHTADLDADTLRRANALLVEVFEGDWTAADWDHACGGMHALVWEGDSLAGHGSVVQRRLVHDGRTLRTGYVEGVAVRRDRQRNGYGAALMSALERVVRGGYDVGALSSTEEALPFYAARGWLRWAGPTYALTPTGVLRTADEDGGIYVLPVAIELDLAGALTCDWRDGELW